MSDSNQREPSTDKVSTDRESSIPEPWEEFRELFSQAVGNEGSYQVQTAEVSEEAAEFHRLIFGGDSDS